MELSSFHYKMLENIDLKAALALIKPNSASIAEMLHECALAPMHPMFTQDRWLGLSNVQFVYLSPALLLASRLLTCREAFHFFHACSFGRSTHDQVFRVYHDPNKPLPPEEKAKVDSMLTDLAELVTIELRTMARECHDARTRPNGLIQRGPNRPVNKSIIQLRPSFLSDINFATRSPDALMRRWVVCATTLAHEVCHCLANAAQGPSVREKRFEDDNFHELGFSFEKFVLGGAVSISLKDTSVEVLHLMTIPVEETKPDECKSQVIRAIEPDDLRRMFLQSFWDEHQ